jgi:hypothetical protein
MIATDAMCDPFTYLEVHGEKPTLVLYEDAQRIPVQSIVCRPEDRFAVVRHIRNTRKSDALSFHPTREDAQACCHRDNDRFHFEVRELRRSR